MALPSNGTVYRALNRSIDHAVKAGRVDPDAQAAIIAAARKVARVMDAPGWPLVEGGRFDNVSPSTFLKYCDALGLSPDLGKESGKPAKSPLSAARSSLKVIRHVS